MLKKITRYIAGSWPEWLIAIILMFGAGYVGGHVGAERHTVWFQTDICE